MNQILREQRRRFPLHPTNSDIFFLRRYVIERATKLRQNKRQSLTRSRARQASNTHKPTSTGTILQVPTQIDRDEHQLYEHLIPQPPNEIELESPQVANSYEIASAPVSSTQSPDLNSPYVVFHLDTTLNKYIMVPTSPSKIRMANWKPISQRFRELNIAESVTSDVHRRKRPESPSLRKPGFEDSLRPPTPLEGNESPRTLYLVSPTSSDTMLSDFPPHSYSTHEVSFETSSQLCYAEPKVESNLDLEPRIDEKIISLLFSSAATDRATYAASDSSIRSSPVFDDLHTFLENGSLAHLYPHLKKAGYHMGIIEMLSHFDMKAIHLALELVAHELETPSETAYQTWFMASGNQESGLEPAYWHLLAVNIYNLGHGRKKDL
ncbi:hypothetical protein BDN72DRAFT_849154 [Pluteus cervinus]|uniref:Uncharacterized protein n=1 Tax=Pluteus cervinus TaxID=181527 RepID=A0ACD3A9B1_9AGAR|nr:hypothetical protein BDN72DRAFT_849154 [Pluteus cervinus]